MKVTVEVAGWFKRFTQGRSNLELDLREGTTAIQAACAAGIPDAEVGFVTVNNTKVDHEYELHDGDQLKVYPLIIGG